MNANGQLSLPIQAPCLVVKQFRHYYLNSVSLFQFNKLSHNCAGVSVLGVLGEEDVFMEDYQDYRDMDTEPLPGYNKRTHK